MAKLLALFTIVPLVELGLMLLLGRYVGFWPTFAMVIITAIAGAWLGKREGLRVWRSWREALMQGRMPEEGILSGVLVLLGAVLLITPGVLTDITGIVLMIPPSRRFVAKHVRRYLEKRFAQGSFQYRVDFGGGDVAESVPYRGGGVVEAEGEVVEEVRPARDRLQS